MQAHCVSTAGVQVSQCVVILYEVFSSSSTSPWHTKGTIHFLRPCSFWLLYCNLPAFVFLVRGVRSILSSAHWEREHWHDLHDVAVTSGQAFRNLSIVLSPLRCLEMAWGHSSWSSVNLSFLLTVRAAKHVSLGTAAKQMQVAVLIVTGEALKLFMITRLVAFSISHTLCSHVEAGRVECVIILWPPVVMYCIYKRNAMCREKCRGRQKAYISENNKCCFP